MWIFSQGQGEQGIERRRTGRTPHKQARSLTQRLRKKAICGWKLSNISGLYSKFSVKTQSLPQWPQTLNNKGFTRFFRFFITKILPGLTFQIPAKKNHRHD